MPAYLAHYAPQFAPAGMRRAAWEKERRERLARPAFIHLSAEEMRIKDATGAHPQVSFVQLYQSASYQEKSRKVLTLGLHGGVWLIEKEQNTRLPP